MPETFTDQLRRTLLPQQINLPSPRQFIVAPREETWQRFVLKSGSASRRPMERRFPQNPRRNSSAHAGMHLAGDRRVQQDYAPGSEKSGSLLFGARMPLAKPAGDFKLREDAEQPHPTK